MKAVCILISLVMVQLAQMEESKSQVKVVPDSGGGGANIVKSLEREIREAKQGNEKNSKSKGKKRPIKRTKNKGKKKGKGENSRKDKKKNVKSKGRKPSKTGRKNKGKKKGKGKNSRKEKQDKRNNVKSKGRKPSQTGRKNKGKNKKDKKASKYKKNIRNKKIDKSNTAGKGKNSKKGKKGKKDKNSMNIKSKGKKPTKTKRKNKGKKKKDKKANKVKNGNRKADKRSKKKKGQKDNSKKGKKDRKNGTKKSKERKHKIKGKANTKVKVNNVNVKQGPVCNMQFAIERIKKYTKYQNSLAKLKRISVWWALLRNKQVKAETTFNTASVAIYDATFNGTECRCIQPAPPIAVTANRELSTCATRAALACERQGISWTKIDTACSNCSDKCENPFSNCTTANCLASCTSKTCTSTCTPTSEDFILTDAMVTHINTICIPELEAWTARYRACTSKNTYKDCSTPCDSDEDQFKCQAEACQYCADVPDSADCIFDQCLSDNYDNEDALTDCQCGCYDSLDTTAFKTAIIDTAVGDLNCLEMAGFERLVKSRRDRCLTKTSDGLSGNFVDCRQQGRNAFFYINDCKNNYCPTSTNTTNTTNTTSTRAPSTLISGRNRFLAEMKNFHLQKRSAGGN